MPEETTGTTPEPKKRRPWWLRAIRFTAITAGIVAALFVLLCSLIVWILTPSRLTPLVEKTANDLLDADVRIGRVELTFWHTFPKLTLDVDSLSITSHAFATLPDSIRRQLPANADSLLSVGSFHGGINLLPLSVGHISLYDVIINRPAINIVQATDSTANYLIFKSQNQEETPDSTSTAFPRISLNRFLITDARPITFTSLPDSVHVAVTLGTLDFNGLDRPRYTLNINGDLHTPLLDEFNFQNLSFSADGRIEWDYTHPLEFGLKDFGVGLDQFAATFNTEIDLSDAPLIKTFDIRTDPVAIADLISHLPSDMARYTEPLTTDMTLTATMELTRPWSTADTVAPSFNATIDVPECTARYENLRINRFAAALTGEFDGTDPDKSRLDIHKLTVNGAGVDINLTANVKGPMSDPRVEGTFRGSVNLASIPPRLRQLIPGTVTGTIDGDATYRFRPSDMSRNNFHRMLATGSINLRNLDATLDSIGRIYTHHATLEFGSNTSFVRDATHKIDSLLTLSLKIDTLAALTPDMVLELNALRAGAGSTNRASSADTSAINPFGMKLEIERLKFDSMADTMRVRLRNASVGGALMRYNGEARLPRMALRLAVDRLLFGQALNKVSLREAKIDLNMHMRPKRSSSLTPEQRAARRKAMADSLAALPQNGDIHFDIDRENSRLLRRWDFSGHVTASRGRLVTPAFPLRNRLRHIDLRFNQDSIVLDNLHYTAGQSDFTVNGTVSNLRRALVSRRNNTLGLRLTLSSDTINVNEIVHALFAGTAVSARTDSAAIWNDADNDTADDRLMTAADTTATGPLLVPRNIDARFGIRAKHVLYSDLVLHRFTGNMLVYDGTINLRKLAASTEAGAISVDGLYNGSAVDSLQFGVGMKVKNFRLDRLTSIVPAIDSLLPTIRNFAGTVNADVAFTSDISPQMDIEIPTLQGAIKIEGDSLVLIDPDTFKSLSKWLMFRDKKHNVINHMAVEVVIDNSAIELYPFMFDIDRYRLGVMGSNDLAMNLNYHISVLKSPIPFKFGINIKGTPDDMKIRLGGAKFKENMVVERQAIADNTRVNIVRQIDTAFRRGIQKARSGRLTFRRPTAAPDATGASALRDLNDDRLSHADSLQFIRQGLIENPDTARFDTTRPDADVKPAKP